MCGRYTLKASREDIAHLFDLPELPPLAPRYNMAPRQGPAAVRLPRATSRCGWTCCNWALIPSWANDLTIGNRMINARAERVAEKPPYRCTFQQRRCLVRGRRLLRVEVGGEGSSPS